MGSKSYTGWKIWTIEPPADKLTMFIFNQVTCQQSGHNRFKHKLTGFLSEGLCNLYSLKHTL